jgi:predicted esterase
LDSLAAGVEPETNIPAARLLDEARELSKSCQCRAPFYTADRAGQFWLTLPTPPTAAQVRVFVPAELKPEHPVPLVVAMHGLGASENMFFEAYGDGAALKLCRERGWMLVGTRAGGLLDNAPPVGAIVSELSKRYPIDPKRIFIMGHSMGAAQALEAVQKSPRLFAAAAALGGGASVRNAAGVKGLPVYVACGSEDFALSAAKTLVRTLEKAEAKVTFKEFPAIEHIVIVQACLRELYDFFEAAGKTQNGMN